MPPGAPHHSFLVPYRIRVDNFSTPKHPSFETPALYLLSHTHSDHITGLTAKSFGARIICSADAKHMLLNTEPAADRIAFDREPKAEKTRPYAHLKIDPVLGAGGKWDRVCSRDLLRVLPLNAPTLIEISDGVAVTITLLNANHCPGAVMFLVEGPQGNVLHTGDVRAEASFLTSLARNPWLQRYILPSVSFLDSSSAIGDGPLRTLDAIYLDTACLLSHYDIPSKEEACTGLVDLISHFPPLTRFFINAWTWGYEDILKSIGRAFNSQIHVDRYKYLIYGGVSDPSLISLLTREAASTRFHACERWDRCSQVEHGTSGVVYVNPVTMSNVKWDLYLNETRARLERGEAVTNLLCPLSRHSTVPELQALVNLFKPKLVVPNSLNRELGNLDWACMPRMFGPYMAEGGEAAIRADMRRANVNTDGLEYMAPTADIDAVDVEVQNLVGEGAEDAVMRWSGGGDANTCAIFGAAATREQRIVTQMAMFLGQRGTRRLAAHLNASQMARGHDSGDSDGGDEAETRGQVADAFFAPTSESPGAMPSTPSIAKARGPVSSHMDSPIFSKALHSIPCRYSSLHKPSPGSDKRFAAAPFSTSSPVHSKVSQISSSSLSSPSRFWSDSFEERAYHSAYDALQFKARSGSSGFMLPSSLKDLRHLDTAALAIGFATSRMGPPCPISSPASRKKDVPDIPQLLGSPSISPSPPSRPAGQSPLPVPKAALPPTPVSGPTSVLQKTSRWQMDIVARPPTLDLNKILKRPSSFAGLSRPPTKRRHVRSLAQKSSSGSLPTTSRAPLSPQRTSQKGPETSASLVSPHTSPPSNTHEDVTPSAAASGSPPKPRSVADKARRQKAKAKQLELRMKLVRALPPDKVAPACKAKVEKQARMFRELSGRNKAAVIAARQRVYGRRDGTHCPSLPQSACEQRPGHQGAASGLQEWTVVQDETGMDWDKSRVYEERIKKQRIQGVRYPQLPRFEKSFVASQSP